MTRAKAIAGFRAAIRVFTGRELSNIEHHLRRGTRVLAGRYGRMYFAPGAG